MREEYLYPVLCFFAQQSVRSDGEDERGSMVPSHERSEWMTTLSQLAELDSFYSYIQKKGINLLEMEQASSGYSLIRMDKKGKINGCMLISLQSDGNLVIPCLVSDDAKDGVIDFLLHLRLW